MIDEKEKEVIRTAYRQAKSPAKQLRIEAELHNVSVKVIREIVGTQMPKQTVTELRGLGRISKEGYAEMAAEAWREGGAMPWRQNATSDRRP